MQYKQKTSTSRDYLKILQSCYYILKTQFEGKRRIVSYLTHFLHKFAQKGGLGGPKILNFCTDR